MPWLLLAIAFTPGTSYFESRHADATPWYWILVHYIAMFALWAAFTPVVAWMLAARPLRRPWAPAAFAMHGALALLLGAVHAAIMAVYDILLPYQHTHGGYLQDALENLISRGGFNLVIYAVIVTTLSAFEALRRQQDVERSLLAAKLDALKAQLEPHFLYNTLNALSELVYRDAAAADRVLTALAGLLRRLLEQRVHRHRLDTEIDLLTEYVAIQQVLLGERLTLDWQVPAETHAALLPTLLLQPLVENAINHGIAQLKRGGAVRVAARRDGGRLVIAIDNDGPPPANDRRDGGIGLGNARARLAALYGGAATLTLSSREGGGTALRIELPWQEDAPP